MNIKERNTVLIGVGLCLLLAVAGWFFLISPKRSDAASTDAATAVQITANTTLQGQIAQLQQQAAGLVAEEANLQKVAARIPADPQLPTLINQIEDIHDRTGVDVTNIVPGPASAPAAAAATGSAAGAPVAASYSVIPVTTTVLGDYAQATLFLNELENLKRLYLVTSIAITPAPAGAGATVNPDGSTADSHTLTLAVTGEVFTTSSAVTTISLPALAGATPSAGATPDTTGALPSGAVSAASSAAALVPTPIATPTS